MERFWKEVPYKNYLYLSLVINVASVLVILLLKASLPPVVPLFYGRPVGQSQLISSLGLSIAPGICLVLTLINLVLAKFTQDLFLKKVLVLSSFFVSILTSITVFKIIFLVGLF